MKQTPNKTAQQKPNSKVGKLVSYRADLRNVRTTYKLKLLHFTEGGTDQEAAADRQKIKKTIPTRWRGYDTSSA
jgi:hypothetical protein